MWRWSQDNDFFKAEDFDRAATCRNTQESSRSHVTSSKCQTPFSLYGNLNKVHVSCWTVPQHRGQRGVIWCLSGACYRTASHFLFVRTTIVIIYAAVGAVWTVAGPRLRTVTDSSCLHIESLLTSGPSLYKLFKVRKLLV